MIRHFVDSVNRFIRGWSNRPTWVLALRSVLSLGGLRYLLLPLTSRGLQPDPQDGDLEVVADFTAKKPNLFLQPLAYQLPNLT